MNGLDRDQIKATFQKAKEFAELELGEKFELIDSLMTPEFCETHSALECLAESLKLLNLADVVVFYGKWAEAHGCYIEYEAAHRYGIPTVTVHVFRTNMKEEEA
jgi:hypothetical protein